MKELSEQRFFRLLSEYSQKELRYLSFGLNRLKSHRVQFEQGEKCLVIAY